MRENRSCHKINFTDGYNFKMVAKNLPASLVNPSQGELFFLLDMDKAIADMLLQL